MQKQRALRQKEQKEPIRPRQSRIHLRTGQCCVDRGRAEEQLPRSGVPNTTSIHFTLAATGGDPELLQPGRAASPGLPDVRRCPGAPHWCCSKVNGP
jgi:hypothetical protein